MSAAVPKSVERCDECGRNPRLINSDMSECSVVECPHRRRCSSEGAQPRQAQPTGKCSRCPFASHFDKVED